MWISAAVCGVWLPVLSVTSGFEFRHIIYWHDSNQATPWSRVLLEKLLVPQLVKNVLEFCETKCSLLGQLNPAACLCPEPDQSSTRALPLTRYNNDVHLTSASCM
jgi:hypothetical protein